VAKPMENEQKYPLPLLIKPLLFFILLLFFGGCLTQSSYVIPANESPPDRKTVTASEPEADPLSDPHKVASLPRQEAKQKPAPPPQKKDFSPREKGYSRGSDQEMLDSALEFCQASNDFWERGDLENAIDALDQAYSLILKVDPGQDPEILQQREDLRFTISKRIIEVYSSRFTVVNGNHKAIPLVMNGHVERALNLLRTKEKKFFLNAYRRSGHYRPAIVKALQEAGLPTELSWLPLIESGFKVRALSRARALGLWQFIASTGYKFGLKRDRWVDERMDPEKATYAAIAYLKELHQIFGDWATVLAAYNCGEGTVLRCIRTQKINYLDHFWDLYEKLPRETAFYVPKFLAVLHILNAPETYGFTLPPVDDPIETEKVPVDKQVHLKTIAKCLEISYSLLRDLNPALRLNSTPGRPYALRVPKGKAPVLLAKLGEIPVWQPPVPSYLRHKVRRGETLSVIARRYHASIRAIMALNGLRSSRFIRAGSTLKIPTRRARISETKGSSTSTTCEIHTVRKGETLSTIAEKYHSGVRAIMALNGLKSSHFIRAGWKLKVPVGTTYAALKKAEAQGSGPPSEEEKLTEYVVRKGDSLWKIARRFGTTTKAIQSASHLNTTRLSIGQVLSIPRPKSFVGSVSTRPYVVHKGDSPYTIALKTQMSLSELLRLNNLTPRSTIFPGQVLLVKAE